MHVNDLWTWWFVGLIPYMLKRRHRRDESYTMEVYALFWSIEIHSTSKEGIGWTIQIPLIQGFCKAIWSAVRRLWEDEPKN